MSAIQANYLKAEPSRALNGTHLKAEPSRALNGTHLKAEPSRALNGTHLKAEQALVNLGALNPSLLIGVLRIGRALRAREIDQR
jgi:hypothetical protein